MIIPLNVKGTIITGKKYIGYDVKVQDDYENTGGFLILVWNDTEGFDDWVQQPKDVISLFEVREWQVKWLPHLAELTIGS